MSTNDKFVPQSVDNNPTQLSTDPNVRVPDHVQAAARAAEELHKQLYTPPTAELPDKTPEQLAAETAAAEEAARAAQAQAAAEGQATPTSAQEQHPAPTAAEQNITADEWRHRFLSMQGRFNAAVRDKGAMEEQMRQLGQELVRTQNLLASGHVASNTSQSASPDSAHVNLITDADREAYGDELIDLARRAALSTVSPELEALRAQNAQLTQRVQTTGKRELFATLDHQLPIWRRVNNDVRFKTWLRLPNVYTGQLRQDMLSDAVAGAEAPKVIALFKDFLAEAAATGQQAPAAQIEQQHAAPRTPALELETLAAPGRARPASGDSQVPSEKPIYSRADISKFYDEKRRGLWAHREQDAQAFENDLTVAQREGRIR
jgi:hypothetical protein